VTTQKQAESNRRNAEKSSGPTSEEGRERSKFNAIKHGMAAGQVLIPGEPAAEFEELTTALMFAWKPANGMEANLVWQIAVAAWRLRRVRRIEAHLFVKASYSEVIERTTDEMKSAEWQTKTLDENKHRAPKEIKDEIAEERAKFQERYKRAGRLLDVASDGSHDDMYNEGAIFQRLTPSQDVISQLMRYEASAERSYYRAIHTLERLQARQMDMTVLPSVSSNTAKDG
jgi:hypothetical protein